VPIVIVLLLASVVVADAAPRVATIEVKGMVCGA